MLYLCHSDEIRRSIRGQNPGGGGGVSSVKCPNSGPSTHSKAVKWDFDENLVPSEVPQLEEEVRQSIQKMRRRFAKIGHD